MDDRELLEMAARAAGHSGAWIKWPGVCQPLDVDLGFFHGSDGSVWNPLVCDGDALRLAVKLHMFDYGGLKQFRLEETRLDPSRDDCAIMRRAIVRAAAEIGRTMTGELK